MAKDDATVKLYRRVGRKRYLGGKYTYEYERIYVPIPSRFHNKIRHLLNHRLNINLTDDQDGILITLHPRENNFARRNHHAKTPA